MRLNYCTLFDSYYLDKGIALAQSLARNASDYKLYIYAFDQKAFDVLWDLKIPNTEIVLFDAIITEQLKKLKEQRTRAEFCWTCTPFIIEYTFNNFKVENCTYIDADLYFYANPDVLIQEMIEKNCSVQIVEHRFPDFRIYRRTEEKSGKYCVEFNTFLNNDEGRSVLSWWKEQCFLCCTSDWRTGKFGDQKYLDEWQEKFSGVHILQHHGGGVAPWNICRYISKTENGENIRFQEKQSLKEYDLVFYHFHDMVFLEDYVADINLYTRPGRPDEKLVYEIYTCYIEEITRIRELLNEKYEWCKTFARKEKIKRTVYAQIAQLIYMPLQMYQEKYLKPKDMMYFKEKFFE